MPDHHDKNSWRSQPTWDLIDNLLDPSADVGFFQALLNERMAMVGAPDILELIAMEAEHSGTPQPQFVEWDPAIAHSRTLPGDDDGIMPLRLRWTEKAQMWAASTLLMIPDKHMSNFGYYDTIAEGTPPTAHWSGWLRTGSP